MDISILHYVKGLGTMLSMKTSGNVLADKIRSLRLSRGLSQAALSRRMGMKPSQLCKIELGHNGLSESSIRRVADALGVTIAELMGEAEERREPVCEGRVGCCEGGELVRTLLDELPKKMVEEVATLAATYDEQMNAARMRMGVGVQSSLQLVYPYGVDEEAAELLARDMRHAIGIGSAPIENLETVLEMHGVHIVRRAFAKQFQSMSFFNPVARTLTVVLNDANTVERNGYRLVYELGAASVFAMSGFRMVRDEGVVHRLLRRFTAAFLMPEEAVRKDVAQSGIMPDRWTFELLVMMKSHFGVSAEAYALRLESLDLIVPELRIQLRDRLRAHYERHPNDMEPKPKDRSYLAIYLERERELKRSRRNEKPLISK